MTKTISPPNRALKNNFPNQQKLNLVLKVLQAALLVIIGGKEWGMFIISKLNEHSAWLFAIVGLYRQNQKINRVFKSRGNIFLKQSIEGHNRKLMFVDVSRKIEIKDICILHISIFICLIDRRKAPNRQRFRILSITSGTESPHHQTSNCGQTRTFVGFLSNQDVQTHSARLQKLPTK